MTDKRLPRTELPPDLRCRHEDCTDRDRFKNEIGFRSHSWHAHGVKYELSTKSSDLDKFKGLPEPEEKTEPEQLDTWQMIGIAMQEVYGWTQQKVVDDLRGGRGLSTFSKAVTSEAGRKFREMIRDNIRDPNAITKNLMLATQPYVFMHWLSAFEAASDAGAYEAVHKMTKEFGAFHVLEENKHDAAPTTVVYLGDSGLDMQRIPYKTSHEPITLEPVQDEDFDG